MVRNPARRYSSPKAEVVGWDSSRVGFSHQDNLLATRVKNEEAVSLPLLAGSIDRESRHLADPPLAPSFALTAMAQELEAIVGVIDPSIR